MRIIGLLFGVALIATILWDTFETIILPRRVTRRIRLTSLFYRSAWKPSFAIARHIKNDRQREQVLSLFGPMSLFFLLGIWASVLIVGYALIFWGTHQPLNVVGERVNFSTHLYLSGVTFFTLGYGEVSPIQPFGRFLSVVETANGFGLFAVVISYLQYSTNPSHDVRPAFPSSTPERVHRRAQWNFCGGTLLMGIMMSSPDC
jgi:hypothetical protein